eukprot:7663658-Pyramimonas_sp.AAC.3
MLTRLARRVARLALSRRSRLSRKSSGEGAPVTVDTVDSAWAFSARAFAASKLASRFCVRMS